MASVESKMLRLKFKTDEGKQFTLSMSYPGEQLVEEGGRELAEAVVGVLMLEQVFNRRIAEFLGADIVERSTTSIL